MAFNQYDMAVLYRTRPYAVPLTRHTPRGRFRSAGDSFYRNEKGRGPACDHSLSEVEEEEWAVNSCKIMEGSTRLLDRAGERRLAETRGHRGA